MILTALCKEQTNLRDKEIGLLAQLSKFLQYIADLNRADIFIDVMTKNNSAALVVAEANPVTSPSLYTQSVVGEPALKKNEPAVFKSFKTGGPVWEVKGVTQEGIPVKQTVIPVKSPEGRVIATLIMEQDISEQIRTAAKVELLSETTEKLTSALLDVASVDEVLPTILQDAVIITNRNYAVLYANNLAQQLLQPSRRPADGKMPIDALRELFVVPAGTKDVNMTGELAIDNRIFMVRHVPFKKGNRLASHIFLLRDVTELRSKEKELTVKAAVIKEIHHRVKNNLHTVAGLLRLQMRRSDSEQVKKAFLNSIHRISSIALIHEVLAVEDIHCIDLAPLVEKVARLSVQTTAETGDSIQVNITGASVQLPSETATATAMVLNELVQNAVEHGLSQTRSGIIKINIEPSTRCVVITITDNGCGLPGDFTLSGSAGLGLTIVDSIVREKLGGDIEFTGRPGTTVKFWFPLPDKGEYSCSA